MTNYDFSTLNCTDLEDLVCELLNAEVPKGSPVQYRTFKEGRDQGIDFLYSSVTKENDHVGQVKHYLKTGFEGLLRELKSKEVDKVKVLDPNRYIFATSLPLSKLNCSIIQKEFNPYINTINDIYGQNDLNLLISKHPNIEKSNYKLWFSSVPVLQTILNSDLDFRSTSFIKDELIKRIRLYVETPLFSDIRESLRSNNTLIITGDPGAGKTTLAEMLIYEYLKEGYKLSFIIDDVHDAERQLIRDDSKQVIYFDDFLGSSEVEISKAMSTEARLLRLISQIRRNENKILILTTRSHLYSKAVSKSEKFQNKRSILNEKIVDLKGYDEEIKKQILLNHIEVSDLNEDFRDVFNDSELRSFIIGHQNFSPRAIEFITRKNSVKRVQVEDFNQFVRSTLNSPINIWEHAYLEQTDNYEKLLLQTLLTFGYSADMDLFEEAFEERLEYEKDKNNLSVASHCWKKTLRQLMDGFIILKENKVSFMNPSLVDYMIHFIKEDKAEIDNIVESILFLEQLSESLFKLTISESTAIKERLLKDYKSFIVDEYYDEELIRIALIIYQYTNEKDNVNVLTEILNDVDDWSGLFEGELNLHFNEFIKSLDTTSAIYGIVQSKITNILNEVILGLWSISEIMDNLKFYDNKFELGDFVSEKVKNHIVKLFEEEMDDEVNDLKQCVLSEGDERDMMEEFHERIEAFLDYDIVLEPSFKAFSDVNWFEVANDNYYDYAMKNND